MLTEQDRNLLLHLLEMPTAGPLETGPDGPRPRLSEAQLCYAEAAAKLGFIVEKHERPAPDTLLGEHVPLPVRLAAADPGFLADQPSMVLRLGPDLPQADTIMFNVHLDTVAGMPPVSYDGTVFRGRGAIDAKGPAVALLAGIGAALAADPSLVANTRILIQAVSGEEGGAMGVFGTRPLVEQGYYGRLNLFCEPTGMRFLSKCTAAMTACVRVDGDDAIDDNPDGGHNATVLLGYISQRLAEVLPRYAVDGRVCVAGIHTGHLHNRVYGTGRLMLNLSYGRTETGDRLAKVLESEVGRALSEFGARYRDHHDLARTAADASAITTVEWHKRGLPTLESKEDEWVTDLLDLGLTQWPADEPAFTCDALWMADRPGTYTAVLGPGQLDRNHAHAEGEYAEEAELAEFADAVSAILLCFARQRATRSLTGRAR
ncbi:acetylornithine deacetylase/succinyl-diaminopimelate desuccinylase-like protein [Kibdelosporangium banguiense]|uniref:Acetylornithine deacetylase/succinyl-diaminopimelate desuccinylase-like protein n=1 Tax=Kibdelosporangium banguiense TaxID=1365924 RepID=A0ABS4TRW8_9PSEU|nr:M20/M25/M40 family metallo-hydrolase [Kibdelosporangium banguiense]MBP2327160.1 acetylornithine deacetylase/succinyl-diaminopimelate desuccinylase-like protein [Kibdelosporangium banguiense]